MLSEATKRWISIKTEALQTPNVAAFLNALKHSESPSTIMEWLPKLHSLKKVRDVNSPAPTPRSFYDLTTSPALAPGSLEKEFVWVGATLMASSNVVTTWLEGCEKIEVLAFKEDYTSALEVLNTIELEVGCSLWSLETRISLIANAEGVDRQKAFAKALWEDEKINPIVQLYAYYTSTRAESKMSCWKYDSLISQLCSTIDNDEKAAAESWIGFLLNFYGPAKFERFENLLWRNSRLPIVDLYLTFVRCAILAVSDSVCDQGAIRALKKVVTILCEHINDKRLLKVLFVLDCNARPSTPLACNDLLSCMDNYSGGKYTECAGAAISWLNRVPAQFEYAELLAKSVARGGHADVQLVSHRPVREIVESMITILLKQDDAEAAENQLRKRCYAWPSSSFSAQLFSFLHREHLSDGYVFSKKHVAFGDFANSTCTPRFSFSIPSQDGRLFYLDRLRVSNQLSPTIDLYHSMVKCTSLNTLGVHYGRAQLYTAKQYLLDGSPQKARSVLTSIDDRSDPILDQDITLCLNRAALTQNDWATSIRLMTRSFVSNPVMIYRLPLKELLDKIKASNADRECAKDIGLCILADAYCQQFSAIYETTRDNAFEDFLDHAGIRRPSEISEIKDQFANDELLYFLKHICTESVLDNSTEFVSTEDLQGEKIAILRLLIELDSKDQEQYSEQIKEITKELVVRRLASQVPQSGIHVEVAGIKRVVEKSLRESYTRYVDLCANSDDALADDLLVRLGEVLGAEHTRFAIVIPRNERLSLLQEIVVEVRDHFVSSNEFGLDGYLSTGMRHGTLSGQIRAPFEMLSLITQRDDATGIYRHPRYWLDWYPNLTITQQNKLSEAVQNFSAGIDALIEKARVQWIQIRTEKRDGEGLFDFRISRRMLLDFQNQLRVLKSYEEFVDAIFAKLWELTDRCLDVVRSRISTDLKNEITELVGVMENSVRSVLGANQNPELLVKITTARTEAQYAVDKIANWFTRLPPPDLEPYTLDLAISIAFEMMKNLFPNTKLQANLEGGMEMRFRGETLKGIVQVLFILLENVRKHCGLESNPIPVAIRVQTEYDFIKIAVSNRVADAPNIEDRRNMLNKAWLRERSDQRFASVAMEKGSGLQKIERILKVDLKCEPALDFSFSDDHLFRAEIRLKSASLTL